MNLVIKPGSQKDTILIPSSKSYANRALILAALSPHDIILLNMPEATDVTHLISALSELGLTLSQEGHDLRVSGSFPACEKDGGVISVGEGGTTARFLAVLLLKGKRKYQLKLGARLKERPWKEFIDLAIGLGAKVDLNSDLLSIQGPIQGASSITVDCSRTTQFFTAFQLVFGHEREINPKNLSSSQSYVRMTEEMIRMFAQSKEYQVPLDWSSASYPLAFAALDKGAEFPGLQYDSFQADAKFLEILKHQKLLEQTPSGLKILPLKHDFSLKMDVSDCLDLVPTLVFFLSHIQGQHCLVGIENLLHKESDRLSECIKLAGLFERKIWVQDGVLTLEGRRGKIDKPLNVTLPDDHRMVMAAALFLRYHGGGTVTPAEAVEKSYPNFFELFD